MEGANARTLSGTSSCPWTARPRAASSSPAKARSTRVWSMKGTVVAEGKRHGGTRRRAAWLFGLAFGLKTRGSPWRAGRKQRFGHGRENGLSPSVWKDTEPRAHVLSEGKGGTEGKREEARGDGRQGCSALRMG